MPFPRGKFFTSVKPGHRHGKWTVVARTGSDRFRRPMFKLRCDCGTETIARWKNSKSCGCDRVLTLKRVNKTKRKDYGESSFKQLYGLYRIKARKRGILFLLTLEQFRTMVKADCFYCGLPPSGVISSHGHYGDFVYNGVDRMDSAKGYTVNNTVSCCKFCNPAKGSLSRQEFFDWACRVVHHMKLKGFKQQEVFSG